MQSLHARLKPSKLFLIIQFALFGCAVLAVLLTHLSWYFQCLLMLMAFGYLLSLLKHFGLPGEGGMPHSVDVLSRESITLCFEGQVEYVVALSGYSVLTPYFAFLIFKEHSSSQTWSLMLLPDHFDLGVYRRLYLRIKWTV